MSDVEIGLAGLGILFFLIALRVPIGFSLIAVSFGGLWYLMSWRVAWGALAVMPYQFAANWVLSSVPMFLMLGFICYHTNLTRPRSGPRRCRAGSPSRRSSARPASRPSRAPPSPVRPRWGASPCPR